VTWLLGIVVAIAFLNAGAGLLLRWLQRRDGMTPTRRDHPLDVIEDEWPL
jgi:hypothetical protein